MNTQPQTSTTSPKSDRLLTATSPQVAVIGTGVMGRGIAQITAQAGYQTLIFDQNPLAAQTAVSFIKAQWSRLAEKGKLNEEVMNKATTRLQVAKSLAELQDVVLVIEAIHEDLDAKRQLFQQLEKIVSTECILATNTSSLPVTAIAAGLKTPGRVVGLHFFNPVPLMKIAEVIGGLFTDSRVVEQLVAFTDRIGHKAVRAQDTPGFIVNHAGRGFGTEGLRILSEGIADIAAIDAVLRDVAGFRMGPFELLDLIGLDVSHPVMESIYQQYYQEPRFRPSPITRLRLVAGTLGRKSGRGFYEYSKDGMLITSEAAKTTTADIDSSAYSLWVAPADPLLPAGLREQLLHKLAAKKVPIHHGLQPKANSICLLLPLGDDTTTTCVSLNLDAENTMSLDLLNGIEQPRYTLAATPLTLASVKATLSSWLSDAKHCVTVINDSPGFIAPRVQAIMVNIACEMAQQRIATPSDIDLGATLGLGYPLGPLAMGDRLGAQRILAILERLHSFYGDPRYRPSPWLKRRAWLGASLQTPEVRS